MNDLLIEIGAEEIPAGYIVPALEAFKDNLLKSLTKNRIDHGNASYYGTPRRLALIVEGIPEMQKAETSTLTGPPEKIGFDDHGNPTIAAEKFAQKAGISIDQITIMETEKGRYLNAVVEEKCESSASILEAALPGLILAIPFPKSMRWANLPISFARPIISLTALLGETGLNFTVGDIHASTYVFGHQFMFPGKQQIESAAHYIDSLISVGVVADINERKAILKKEIKAAAKENNAVLLKDEALEDINTNLVEYPYPVVGKFDDEFLEVPDEALITAMREHQKYFALTDENGNLKPLFIAVNNTKTKDMDLVARGHERVIRARLADAKFFCEVDLESSMDQFAEKLKNVTFQADLGTMFEKLERLTAVVEYLCDAVGGEGVETLKANVVRAARLCKADLVSQMVIEFPKLQGVIGRVYAEKAGEDPAVSNAIEQHYRPVYSGGALPEELTGKLLAIADKIDSICGCFSIDLIPTGASDPYALRRQGIGILQILAEGRLSVSLNSLVEKGVSEYVSDPAKTGSISSKIIQFLQRRMVHILVEQGFSREAVNSALAVSFDDVPDDILRIKALDDLRKLPDFEPLSTAFKRVVNIMKKTGSAEGIAVDESLFESNSEKTLYRLCNDVSARVKEYTQNGDYEKALKEIATLRPDVDTFFDDVMVMVDDEAVKSNRIALLSSVSGLFSTIADFSMI